MDSSRKRWVDVAKGLAIIAVVFGHSGEKSITHYLFWFHMPVFFALSGYFFKPINNIKHLWEINLDRAKKLLTPYICYGLLLTIATYFYLNDKKNPIGLVEEFGRLIYGGKALYAVFGPFWFITCLLLTQILFSYITFKVSNTYIQILIVTSVYVVFHNLNAIFISKIGVPIPWSLDVSFIALFYYAIGFLLKHIIHRYLEKNLLGLLSCILAVGFIIADKLEIIQYKLDMKYEIYQSLLLDSIIPFIFILAVIYISYKLGDFKVSYALELVGRSSLTIMYLHIFINEIMRRFITINFITFTFIGVLVPMFIHYFIINRSSLAKNCFMGHE